MNWKTISIFISSTFNDMQSERDYIRKFVIPRLSEELSSYKIYLQVTDLRWGIDTHETDENEREAKVLHVCMNAIRNNRPYFIALLGERYGWVPPLNRVRSVVNSLAPEEQILLGKIDEAKSVTEMEILLGAIGSSELLPHSFFCFRGKNSYDNMEMEERKLYIDAFSDNDEIQRHAQKLESLKNKIKDQCRDVEKKDNLLYYDVEWDGKEHKFTGFDQFGEELYQLLLKDILFDIEAEKEEKSSLEMEKFYFDSFVTSHLEDFKGRKALIDKLINFLLDSRSVSTILDGLNGIFLSGFSGCGKSSVFSILYDQLTRIAKEKSLFVLGHAAGISPKSILPQQMIDLWSWEMTMYLGDSYQDEKHISVQNFQNLLMRIQAKGLFPIILIDSLDSFVKDSLITNFNFIPYNVPFICTSLPGCAGDIIAKHSNYFNFDIDVFTYEDAQLVIEDILRKNSKELSCELRNKLLSITDSKGCPAYYSPLWVRMAMSILMELGTEDFNEIHRENCEKEDQKIEVYLNKIIEKFPGDAESLFEYLLNLTCRYFNEDITRKSLTYIAISQYGIRENDLSELIGETWSQLEFNSLRYWLRDFIQCNNKDRKWFFTHSILKKILLHQDEGFVIECKKLLFGLLSERALESIEEKKEFIYQIVISLEYDVLDNYIEEFDTYDLDDIFYDFLFEIEEQTLSFLDCYLAKYYKKNNAWIDSLAGKLMNETEASPSERKTQLALSIYDMLIEKFKETDYLSGDKYLISDFFRAHEGRFDYFYQNEMYEEYGKLFLSLKQIYLKNKELHSDHFVSTSTKYDFYCIWKRYLFRLSMQCKYEDRHAEYKRNFDELLAEIEWYMRCMGNSYSTLDTYVVIFNGELSSRNRALSKDELIAYAQRIQDDFLKLCPSEKDDDFVWDTFYESGDKLVLLYEKLFDNKADIIETPLLQMLKKELVTEPLEDEWDDGGLLQSVREEEENVKCAEILFMSEDEMADMDSDEWQILTEEDFDREEGSEEEETGIPSEEEIRSAETALDNYIRNNPLNRIEGEKEYSILDNYYNLFKSLANLHLRAGNDEKAIKLMQAVGTLLIKVVFDMGDNYAMGEDETKNIVNLSKWFSKRELYNEQMALLESVSEAIVQSYYHHIDGDAQNYLLRELLELYGEQNLTDKQIAILEKRFEICYRYQIERIFSPYDYCYRDLSYVRPVYNLLYDTLKKAKDIKKGVIAIEMWLDLCEKVYVDEKDTGYGYDDIDEAYDQLACLYDGTPTLVEGMKERNSIFLKDKCILVCFEGKWGYISHDGKVLIPCVYDRGWKAESDILSVCKNGKWGYISMDGHVVIDFKLDTAIPIREEYARIRVGDNWAVIKSDGTFIPLETNCEQYHDIKEGIMKVSLKKDHDYRQDFLKLDGQTLLFNGKMQNVKSINQGVIVASYYDECSKKHTGLFDMNGNIIVSPMRYEYIVPFGDQTLTPAGSDDKLGFINRQGEEIIPMKYSQVRPFSNGVAPVAKSGRTAFNNYWGFINETGEEILPIKYNDVGDFHEGLAWVCFGESRKGFGFRGVKFGFINTLGEFVIPMIYDDVSSFYNSRALVFVDGESFYIDRNGEKIK